MSYLGKELEAALHDIKLVSRRLLELERNQQVPKPGRPTIAEWMGQQKNVLQAAIGGRFPRNPILDRLSFRDMQGLSLIIPTMRGQITYPLEALSVEFDFQEGELGKAAEIVENFALPALIDKFMHLLFYGNPEHGVKGLHQIISHDLTIHAGSSTGTALSHTKLNELLCNIQEPELIVSTPRVCALMMTYLQSIGLMGGGIEEYPAGIASYKTVPWFATNALRGTENATGGGYSGNTDGINSSLFVLNFDALQGIHNGGIQLRQEGDRGYLTWSVAAILKDASGCGKIDGIWPGSVLA